MRPSKIAKRANQVTLRFEQITDFEMSILIKSPAFSPFFFSVFSLYFYKANHPNTSYFPFATWRSSIGMARGNRTPFYTGLSLLFYLTLLFSPLALFQTASAQSDQDPLQESYGTGMYFFFYIHCKITRHCWQSCYPVVGIDLGTTYSCVGVMQKGKVEILVNDQGHRITPSYVAFTDDERLVGDAAKNQAAANPKRTIFDIK